jgi:2-polyprenyl-3-methyl-5-hydroxy-6-metoxy-1,4-benzoquinol methylase
MLDAFWPDMSRRPEGQELLNHPQADAYKRRRTLKQFSLLNRLFSPAGRLLKNIIIRDMQKSPQKTYSILDIGTGGCDLPIWLARRCKRLGLSVNITAMDKDRRIAEYARGRCRAVPNITVVCDDAFHLESHPVYDYIFASNVLHHLRETGLPGFLRLVHEHTGRRFLLKDLYRSRPAFLGFSLFAAVFLRTGFHFNDGRISIRRGFKAPDLERIIRLTGLNGAIKARRTFPAAVYFYGRGGARHNRD